VNLSEPANYFPWRKGLYEVAPNLRKLGTDFGNGTQDAVLIQLDSEFSKYRANKEAAFAEDCSKYLGVHQLPPDVLAAVLSAMAQNLVDAYPDIYSASPGQLTLGLTGETIRWHEDQLARPADLLQEASLLIQPDFVIICRTGGEDRVAGISVCAPSHWRPSEKLGQSFFETHTVVPGFEKINAVAGRMVDAIINQGPFVRFVWGVESDDRFNHHLDTPEGWNEEEWLGRLFDRQPVWVRTERQSLLGLPEVEAAIFVIHARTVPVASIGEVRTLASALESMSPAAREYKGVDTHFDALMAQLR
jgi:hypothetical protein